MQLMERNYFPSLLIAELYIRKAGLNSWSGSKGSPLQGSQLPVLVFKLHYYPICRTKSKKLQLKWKTPVCSYLPWARLPSYHLRLQTTLSAIWERKCLQSYKIDFLWKTEKPKENQKPARDCSGHRKVPSGSHAAHATLTLHGDTAALVFYSHLETREGYPRQQLELSAKEGLSRPHGLSKITAIWKASISHCISFPPIPSPQVVCQSAQQQGLGADWKGCCCREQ